jgi:DNA-binding NarL/FixJ family response regulator
MTRRQQQILQLLSLGLTEQQVADELGLGRETVKSHSKEIRRHLGARSKTHAVAIGFQTGLLR